MTVTLLTGASSGIGRSLALRLSDDPLALVARRKNLLDTLAAEIEAGGGQALALPCDVTDPAQVGAAVAAAEARFGPLERLIANAGGGRSTEVESFRAAEIEEILRLNVVGVANCIEAVLPGMLARGRGHIVVTSSLAAWRGLPGAAAYCAAKAALTAMTESLRIDLAPHGVDVTVLSPGFVRTRPEKRRKRFQLDLETATARMARAIRARRKAYAFPLALVLATGFGRLLPAPLYDGLLTRRRR
ncbi:MAG TPA: SDR family NAD(P)-dependent oxidoreductase [Geminicoccaceae bacterium]|nr:SDR family NAD(P)-dependent oxidoreductase [Geminicoccaceae bacterium]